MSREMMEIDGRANVENPKLGDIDVIFGNLNDNRTKFSNSVILLLLKSQRKT